MNFFESNLIPHGTRSFHVSTLEHHNELSSPPRANEFHCIHFVLSGVYHEKIEGKQFRLGVGEVLYKPANVLYSNTFEIAGARTCRIQFYGTCVRVATVLGSRLPDRPIHLQTALLSNAFFRIQSELLANDNLASLAIECLCWEVVFQIVRHAERRQTTRNHGSVERVIERLKSEYRSPPRVSDLADWIGMHRSQLARQFRSETGMTIAEFVRFQRVQLAMQLLQRSGQSLSSVAIECGFVDQSHLTSSFRKVTGFTPAAWRSGQKQH